MYFEFVNKTKVCAGQNALSQLDSIRMILYAKIINKLDEKITKINSKYID